MSPDIVAPIIAVVAVAGVILRPFGWPEFLWALAGAAALLVLGVLSPAETLGAAAKGDDVYLFLTGMMLLSELARQQCVFDYLAVVATRIVSGLGAFGRSLTPFSSHPNVQASSGVEHPSLNERTI